MDTQTISGSTRRPRFRRASEPPAFRVTDDDVVIIRQLARYRFLRSTHIAALVGRSVDRTNDRLRLLYHAGYLDRPHAQLDYYPTSGSAPMVYALANRGARLLIDRYGIEFANVDWSRKNHKAGRSFIEHQLEIVDFQVGLDRATRDRDDIRVMHADEIIASMPDQPRVRRNPFALRVKLMHKGIGREVGVVPDFVFALQFLVGAKHSFMVEIDRGTMPVVRSDFEQTSFAKKMRAYLTAHAAKQHEQRFGWKTFRVLTVTTDEYRKRSMIDALRSLRVAHSPGASLFLFATREQLRSGNPVTQTWQDGNGHDVSLTSLRL
jgi:protein involved in plasmid replication-relaxation